MKQVATLLKHSDRGDVIKGVSGAFIYSSESRSKILKDFYLDSLNAQMYQGVLQVNSLYADTFIFPMTSTAKLHRQKGHPCVNH
jgi:hypothetical protein